MRAKNYFPIFLLNYLFKLRPEADPAVLLAWIENDLDLANIHRAARVREECLRNISFERSFVVKRQVQHHCEPRVCQ